MTENRRSPLPRLWLPLLLCVIASIYVYTAMQGAILDDGDALYAHVAQEMVERNDWVTPYANGVRFLDKPPLMYWLMALSYSCLGATEFAARLPSILAVIGIAWLLYLIGMRSGGQSAGFIAGMASAFCLGTFLFTRMVFPDILFVFFLTLALYSFLEWYVDPRSPLQPAMLFYASMAAATLTKGLLGIFFPAAIVAVFMLWSREWRRLKAFHPTKGAILFLALVLPWHILAAVRNSGFLWYFFVNEQLLRFLGRREPFDYQSISLPVFWALILVWLFPWSAFLPAIRSTIRDACLREPYPRAAGLLCICWAGILLAFFSVSSRIEHYSLPLIPPLVLLIGMALGSAGFRDPAQSALSQRWVDRGFAFLSCIGGLAGIVVTALWWTGSLPGIGPSMAGEARFQAYRHYFEPLFDLSPRVQAGLFIPLVGTAMLMLVGFLAAWWLNSRRQRMLALASLFAVMGGFFLFAYQALGVCEEALSSRDFARVLSEIHRPDDMAVVLGDFETANSLNFYVPTKIGVYSGSAAVLEWGLRYADAPRVIYSRKDLEKRWKSGERTFLLIPDVRVGGHDLDGRIPGLHLRGSLVYRSAGRALFCNQPVDRRHN